MTSGLESEYRHLKSEGKGKRKNVESSKVGEYFIQVEAEIEPMYGIKLLVQACHHKCALCVKVSSRYVIN